MESIAEAKRYISNAKEILRDKAKKEDGFYQDKKYIRMAGNTAYSGVLEALDGIIIKKGKGRKSVDWYKEQLAKLDKKILHSFIAVYDTMHLSLGYDGNPSVKVAQDGFEKAETIIKWVENQKN